MRWMTLRVVLTFFALGIAPRIAAAQNPAQQLLSVGDSILIAVDYPTRPELSGLFGVRADGTIGSPVYSSIRVVGVPLPEVESQVRAYLAANVTTVPRVIVDPFFQVAVAGEVRQPGVYGLGAGGTVYQAVLRAGGVTERGALDRVVLYRGGRTIGIDLTRPDPTMGGMQIQSGDQLVVRPRREIFRNYILPIATLTGAAAAIINALDRQRF